jgi:hypothetical protein
MFLLMVWILSGENQHKTQMYVDQCPTKVQIIEMQTRMAKRDIFIQTECHMVTPAKKINI